MPRTLSLEAAGASDVGKGREHNEDSVTVDPKNGLYAIADGMGGHRNGEVASQSAIAELTRRIESHRAGPARSEQDEHYDVIVNAVDACNELVLEKNSNSGFRQGQGMGTTLVGALFLKRNLEAVVFNVGDSRLYRLRDNELTQLTSDHTMYRDWFESGQSGAPPSKNILVKAVGMIANVQPDVQLEKVLSGDIYMLCSDGLSNLVEDSVIRDFISANPDLPAKKICSELIRMANDNGGDDNITVIIIKADELPPCFPG